MEREPLSRGRGAHACALLAAVLLAAACGGGTPDAAPPGEPCALGTPGPGWVVFSSNRGGDGYGLYLVRADGTCLSRLAGGPLDALLPTASPDGKVAWTSPASGVLEILVQPVEGGVATRLDLGGLGATAPSFSPDGRWIAFEGYAPGVPDHTDVYVVAAQGGAPRRVTDGVATNAAPAWSPDGATLYFVSTRGGGHDVYCVPAAGGAVERITVAAAIVGRPAVSPDGRALAYARPAAGDAFSEVAIRDLATGAERVVSRQQDFAPAFDATGRWLVVTSYRSGQRDLWLLDVATGAGARPITADDALDGDATFLRLP